MKAAILHAPDQPLTVEEIDINAPAANEVLVHTAVSGVCHSDMHYVDGKRAIPYPAVLGHEASGIVEAVGTDVTYVRPGDHVIMSFRPFCGHCKFCLSGRPNLCAASQAVTGGAPTPFLGWSSRDPAGLRGILW